MPQLSDVQPDPENRPRHWLIGDETVVGAGTAAHALAVYNEARNPPVLPPTLAEYSAAVQHLVDATARARQYADGASLASYVGSNVPAWAAEAAAFLLWRDAVWLHAYIELGNVKAGKREQPSVAELLAELPVVAWPNGAA